ncbi:hypothetical protein [Niallia taxi]|uniref:hypothetical protein n=1 Tax=Niallia taxi TaxID=2499688 RepID=UPI0030098BEC
MKIRKAIIEDASGISRVHVDAWRTTYKNLIPDSFFGPIILRGKGANVEGKYTEWQCVCC